MSLNKLVQEDVATVSLGTSIVEASKMMLEKHVGCIIVTESVTSAHLVPAGILTDRDIALFLAKKERLDFDVKVDDIMTKKVIVGEANDGIYETIKKMRSNGIKRLPIVNREGNLKGIVSADDLFALVGEEIQLVSQIIENERSREGLNGAFFSKENEKIILQN